MVTVVLTVSQPVSLLNPKRSPQIDQKKKKKNLRRPISTSRFPVTNSSTTLQHHQQQQQQKQKLGRRRSYRETRTVVGSGSSNRRLKVSSMFSDNQILSDVLASAISGGVALSLLQFWGEIGKRGLIDQKLNRKLVHISIGLVFMLLWPLFSHGRQAAVLAALVPGVNIIRMLLVGSGMVKDASSVKSMTRSGDYRELLKGPLYYATTITFASIVYWRTSLIGVAAICNLCAGDGLADIVGRRFGKEKLPYNRNKSYAGSIAMATAGFLSSVGYMHYFSTFGFVEESMGSVVGLLIVSLVTAVVESLPISTDIDDNLTVPLTSILVGSLVL